MLLDLLLHKVPSKKISSVSQGVQENCSLQRETETILKLATYHSSLKTLSAQAQELDGWR